MENDETRAEQRNHKASQDTFQHAVQEKRTREAELAGTIILENGTVSIVNPSSMSKPNRAYDQGRGRGLTSRSAL